MPGSYTTSTNRGRARNYERGITYSWKEFTLNENGGIVMVTYGTSLASGDYDIRYEHVENGGCKAYSTLSATY